MFVRKAIRRWLIIACMLLLVGCSERGKTLDQLPTPLTPEAYLTEVFLTEVAPPIGFDVISYPTVDTGLTKLSGWRYETLLEFKGTFAQTGRETSASIKAEVWYNQLASARRIVASISGDLLTEEPTVYEAVQLGPDTFFLVDNVCMTNADESADFIDGLGAGTLIGGVTRASTAYQKATINGEPVWRYAFTPTDLNLPNLRMGDNAQILAMTGDIWAAPEHPAVIRFTVNLEVENAVLLNSPLPVTGTLIIRYDLYDIGVVPNLSVPFGC